MADSSPIGPWRERMANLSPDRHALAWGTGIAVLGLAIRATNLLDFTELPWFWVPRVDSDVYHRAAKRVAHGDLSLRGISEGLSTAYFYFLGAVYRLCGDDAWAPRLVQAVLGVGTGLLVWRTARRVAGPWLGVVAGVAAVAYGPSLFYESVLLPETLGMFAHAWLLWLVVRAAGNAPAVSARRAFAAGVAFGLAVLVRPSALLLAVPVVIAFAGMRPWATLRDTSTRRSAAVGLGTFALGAALLVAPATCRNVLVDGERVAVVASGGLNLYIGNGPGANGTMRSPPELPPARSPEEQFVAFRAVAERAAGHPLSRREVGSYWSRRTITYALEHPVDVGGVLLRKLRLFWNGRELSNIYRYELLRTESKVLGLPWVQFAPISALALFGLVWGAFGARARREGPRGRRIALLFAAIECLSVVLVFVTARHRMLAVPSLLVVAAYALRAIRDTIARGRHPRLLVAAGVLLASVVVVWPVPVHDRQGQGYLELAEGYHALDNAAAEERMLRRAVAVAEDKALATRILEAFLASRATGTHSAPAVAP